MMFMRNPKKIIVISIFLLLFSSATVFAKRLSVGSEIANVRSGPGTTNEIVWKIEKYHPVKVVKTKGAWVFFEDFEGDRGWIHKTLLKPVQAIIIKSEKCNIRSGPGLNFEILLTVDKGVPFKVIGKKGAWINVEHADGDAGWIHKSLVW